MKLTGEEGIDPGEEKPRHLTRELVKEAEPVVVVCGFTCPLSGVVRQERWELPDPAGLGLEEARRVRDGIKRRVGELVERLRVSSTAKGTPA